MDLEERQGVVIAVMADDANRQMTGARTGKVRESAQQVRGGFFDPVAMTMLNGGGPGRGLSSRVTQTLNPACTSGSALLEHKCSEHTLKSSWSQVAHKLTALAHLTDDE